MIDLVQLSEDLLLQCLQEVLIEDRVGGRRRIGLSTGGTAAPADSADYTLNFLRILF